MSLNYKNFGNGCFFFHRQENIMIPTRNRKVYKISGHQDELLIWLNRPPSHRIMPMSCLHGLIDNIQPMSLACLHYLLPMLLAMPPTSRRAIDHPHHHLHFNGLTCSFIY